VKNIGPLPVFFFPEFVSRKKIEKILESFSSVSLTNYANFCGEIRQIFDINKLEKKNPGLLSGCVLLCLSKENGQ
jgi:hypothetical protein